MKVKYEFEPIMNEEGEISKKVYILNKTISLNWKDYKTLGYIFVLLSMIIWFFLTILGISLFVGNIV